MPKGEDIGWVNAAQLRPLTDRLDLGPAMPMFVFDAGYNPIAFTVDRADLPVAILARIRCERVFYTAPAPAPGRLGRPLGKAPASSAPTRPNGRLQTRRCRPTASHTAGWPWPPGPGCPPIWSAAGAEATAPRRRS